MKKKVDITISILNYNCADKTIRCIESIRDLTIGISFEIIVVDNKSTDDSFSKLQKINNISLIEAEYNCGFSRGNNLALRRAKGKYCILLNPDTILKNNALKILFDFMELHPNAGAIGPQLYSLNNEKQFSYGIFRSLFHRMRWEFIPELKRLIYLKSEKKKETKQKSEKKNYKIIGRPRGCAFMIKTSNLYKVGYLDERFFMYNEETDWALRFINFGFDNYFIGDAEIYHEWGVTTSDNKNFFDLVHTSSYYKYYSKYYGYKAEILLRLSFMFGAFLNLLLIIISPLINKISPTYEFEQFKNKIKKSLMFYDPLPEDTKKYLFKKNKKFN